MSQTVGERVFERGRDFEFFQLVRLLLRDREESVSPGGEGPAGRETIRFRPAASLAFAAADIEDVTVREIPGAEIPSRYVVTVNFMGLYGPASPLPNHFTEDLIWSGIDGETMRDFLDLFHHRLISFVYRAWEKYRHAYQFEPDGSDVFTRRAFCLLGLGTRGVAENAGVPVVPLLRMAGALAERHRSAEGLRGYLSAEFDDIPISIETCVERATRIPAAWRTRLGNARGESAAADAGRLGETAVLGERIRDRAGSFRVTIGPIESDAFRRFLPGGDDLTRLARLTRLYLLDPLDFEVEVRLEAREVPPVELSPAKGLGLGWMSWLAPRGAADGDVRIPMKDLDPFVAGGARGHGAPATDDKRTVGLARSTTMGATSTTRRF